MPLGVGTISAPVTRRALSRIEQLAERRLRGEKTWKRERFLLRLERWWEDVEAGLEAAYGPGPAAELGESLVVLAAGAYSERHGELARLDEQRILRSDWFQSESMLGYAAYPDRFAGDLPGIAEAVGYLEELGVTYLHLMPVLMTRDGDSDGGYAVTDHRRVRSDLGSIDDLRALTGRLRRAGISLALDLVANHVAREHPWAEAARRGDERYRAFFHLFDDRELPDAYERNLPEVFPGSSPGNFTWDDELGAWVWTTFNSFQWDLDWSNPEVFAALAEVALFLANAGVEVLRLDAIAFIWKRLGTDCRNQPEVQAIIRALRGITRIATPAVALLAEATAGPQELVGYLGVGADHGKLCDLAHHNILMVHTWSTLASRDVRLAAHALSGIPPKPESTAWVTYVRGHDDIDWAVSDADAAAVGLDGRAHRRFLSEYYSGEFPGSPAGGLVSQHNQRTEHRRISGTTASLAGRDSAGDDPTDLDTVIARILLAHAVALGWGGTPVLWMGDEIALGNDPGWADEPGHESDNRWAHRPRMDWERAELRHLPGTVEQRVWSGIRHLATVRSRLPQLHASIPSLVLPVVDPGVLAVARRHPLGPLVELYNFTESARSYPADLVEEHSGLRFGVGTDALTASDVGPGDDGKLRVAPHEALWVLDRSV